MPNHFHVVVRAKGVDELASTLSAFETLTELDQSKKLSRQFSHLFNSYAQAFNKKYERRGNLFQRPFKRNTITSQAHLKQAILYVHRNPVHHGFTERMMDWPFTSYESFLSQKATQLARKEVLQLFESELLFKQEHESVEDAWMEQMAEGFEYE